MRPLHSAMFFTLEFTCRLCFLKKFLPKITGVVGSDANRRVALNVWFIKPMFSWAVVSISILWLFEDEFLTGMSSYSMLILLCSLNIKFLSIKEWDCSICTLACTIFPFNRILMIAICFEFCSSWIFCRFVGSLDCCYPCYPSGYNICINLLSVYHCSLVSLLSLWHRISISYGLCRFLEFDFHVCLLIL